jgi:iron complex transport system ATP-binding protein
MDCNPLEKRILLMSTRSEIVNPLLVIDKLSIGYSSNSVLNNLNLSLRAGELVCFMGPNGIGKSSLIKTLVGLLKPLSGSLHFSESGPIEKVASVVLTDRVHHPQLLVEELITMGRYPFLDWRLKLQDADRTIINDAIQLTNIEYLRLRKISELSDGQMQMVMIARALTQNTKVLLLDEPTAHLDLNNRVEIMNLLKRLSRDTGRAILIATHELDLALQTADQVWIAGPDKTIRAGIPEDLVLNGSFDQVFKFKGYDLKTGKITHEEFRKKNLSVNGDGYALLWTKNALERNGYSIIDSAKHNIQVSADKQDIKWKFLETEYSSLEDLLRVLNQIN